MIRSYEYSENIDLSINLKDSEISKKELLLVQHIVADIQKKYVDKTENHNHCPICEHTETIAFYSKWNETYRRCSYCKSIYCDCDQERIRAYVENKELITFRKSPEYQEDAILKRKDQWEENIKWLRFRIFRYLQSKEGNTVIDYGNRYRGLTEIIRNELYTENYCLKNSILDLSTERNINNNEEDADVLIYMNVLQQEYNPREKFIELSQYIRKGGLLVVSCRAGSGFDILALQENHQYIYPYEHIMLPSVKGLILLLESTKFEVLEVATPGSMDVGYVYTNKENIKDGSLFLQIMIEEHNKGTLQEFQRFLQKNSMSSYVQIIARKV